MSEEYRVTGPNSLYGQDLVKECLLYPNVANPILGLVNLTLPIIHKYITRDKGESSSVYDRGPFGFTVKYSDPHLSLKRTTTTDFVKEFLPVLILSLLIVSTFFEIKNIDYIQK